MSDLAEQGPVFIGGPHRSGTGMLRAVLGSNSALAIPPKEYQFFDRAGSLPDGDPAARLHGVLQWPKVREWRLDSRDASAMLTGTDGSERAIYAAPLKAYAAMSGKPRFGEKTPFLERHFETLLQWFGPGVRFVQIIRDPFATYASLRHQDGHRQIVDPVRFARRWRASALRGLHNARRHPDQFRLVRYEAFVADPEPLTRALCDFCALPAEIERMLAMADFTRKRNSSFGDKVSAAMRQGEIGLPVADSAARVPRFDGRLIRRELGSLAAGILDMDPVVLPQIPDEDDGATTVPARISMAAARIGRWFF